MSFIAVGIGVAAVGVGVMAYGAVTSNQNAHAQLDNQKEQQQLQQQQNDVNATRQQRQMIREGIVARANATAASTNQGSQLGSGLEGAISQTSAQVASNVGAVGQNLAFGQAALALKQSSTEIQGRSADSAMVGQIGSGLTSLGGGMIKNAGEIQKVGTYLNSRLFS